MKETNKTPLWCLFSTSSGTLKLELTKDGYVLIEFCENSTRLKLEKDQAIEMLQDAISWIKDQGSRIKDQAK